MPAKAQPPATKPVQLGPPLAWTETDLDALSKVTDADAYAAADWYRRNAPPAYKRLLDAAPVVPDAGSNA